MSVKIERSDVPAVDAWVYPIIPSRAARNVLLVLIGSALLTLSAYVQVPFWPVKMSMQSAVVLLIGLTCGSRLGGVIVLAYLAQGAAGLPVFQSGGGLAYMSGSTGGYLLGFLMSATIVGALVERGALRSWSRTGVALAAGVAAIYLPGIAWLAVLFGWEKSLAYGLYPFIPAELFKMALAFVLARLIASGTSRRA